METKRGLNVLLLGLGIILIAGLILWILTKWPFEPLPAEQPPPPTLDTSAVASQCPEGSPPEGELETNGVYILNQLVLDGPADAVKQVAGQRSLSLIWLCLYDSDGSSFAMGLYSSQSGENLEELRNDINTNPQFQDLGVTADFNYLISQNADAGSCVDPYSDGGSPYSDGGSPTGTLNRTASGQQLLTQWAISEIGLTYKRPATTNDGKVYIAIFDTAPQVLVPGQIGLNHKILHTLAWPNPASNDTNFYLTVSDAIGNSPIHGPNEPFIDVSDHGLFVAGLARIVAPDSQIHLIRVLGKNGCGDMMKLVVAIRAFTAVMKANHIDTFVLNLSLGLPELPAGISIPKLENALRAAYNAGAVIVAATGNDSWNLTTPANAQLPAAYDFVIGVAATNDVGERSCYSNRGRAANQDTSAPGGEGGPFDTKFSCVSRTMSWNTPPADCKGTMAECRYGLISVIEPTSQNSTTKKWAHKYGFWSGTSFSTPLVSGLAALAYKEASATRDQVYCIIQKGSRISPPDPNLGWGIINIQDSLSDTTCQSSPQ
jgi:subtilisin family serine protease